MPERLRSCGSVDLFQVKWNNQKKLYDLKLSRISDGFRHLDNYIFILFSAESWAAKIENVRDL